MARTITVKNLTPDTVVVDGEVLTAAKSKDYSYFTFQDNPDLCSSLSTLIAQRKVDAFVDNAPTPLTADEATALWQYPVGGGGGGGNIGDPVVGGTVGSVLFVNSGGNLGQDNTRLFWDTTNWNLGVGTNTAPAGYRLAVRSNLGIAGDNCGLYVDMTQSGSNPSPNTTRGAQIELTHSGNGTQYVGYGYNSYLYNTGIGNITYGMAANNRILNTGDGTITNAYAAYNYFSNSATGGGGATNAAFGAYNRVRHNATSVMGTGTGVYSRVENTSTGTFTAAVGVTSQVRNTTTGTIGTAYGVACAGWSNSGTVTTSYGIYMDSSVDIGTTRWALYSESTSDSYMAGSLDIAGLQVTNGPVLQQRASALSPYDNETYSTTITHQSEFNFIRSNDNTLGTLATTLNGTWLGRLTWRGVGGFGTTVIGAEVYAQQEGAAGVGNVPTRLTFSTASSGSPSPRLVISSIGLLGVNQTSPQATLDVTGSFSTSITTVNAHRVIGDANAGDTDYTLLVDAGGGSIVLDLPVAVNNARRHLAVKVIDTNGGANSVTVRPQGADTIDNVYTFAAPWSATIVGAILRIHCDGSDWHTI